MTSLSMWTIYDHPTDYPTTYVARQYRVGTKGDVVATENIIISHDLDIIRETLLCDMHLHRIERNEDDDPKIIETWL